MKEIPILFSTPMVNGLLSSMKTKTRRTKGLEDVNRYPDEWKYTGFVGGDNLAIKNDLPKSQHQFIHKSDCRVKLLDCPYGKFKDILWVREKYLKPPFITKKMMDDGADTWPEFDYGTCSENEIEEYKSWGWKMKPSIHMPRAACRIFLKVKSVRVERLHKISEVDILAEGIFIPTAQSGNIVFELGVDNSALSFLPDGCFAKGAEPLTNYQSLFAFWAELWCKINGRASWDANPWVWVIEFERIETLNF